MEEAAENTKEKLREMENNVRRSNGHFIETSRSMNIEGMKREQYAKR